MNQIVQSSLMALAVPAARVNLSFRTATMDDAAFIDDLIKTYNNQLGFFPTAQIEGYIKGGWVIVAEEVESRELRVESEDELSTLDSRLSTDRRVGFIASRDRYFKRDECGIVYLLCVKPGVQRKFVGAALLREVFDRSPYGCRSYCCWCAQDIEANHFWESMGFVPLAYRNGAEKKGPKGPDGKRTQRVHIFWQKKIRGINDGANWWFPAKTDLGAMDADRIVLPIPPGVHWSEVKPIELKYQETEPKWLEEEPKPTRPTRAKSQQVAISPTQARDKPLNGGLMFALPTPVTNEVAKEKPKKPAKVKKKIDPQFASAARELRDRYLEQVNENGYRLESAGKYELVRGELRVESRELREKNALPLSTLNPQLSTDAKLLVRAELRANASALSTLDSRLSTDQNLLDAA